MDLKEKVEISNIFEWLDEIMIHKRNPNEFSEESWNVFNSWLIHRFVSMYDKYVDIANIAQKIPLTEKEKVYTVYKTMLPKKKVYLKYIKNENKKDSKELTEYIAEYFRCSLGEANEYIDLLQEYGIKNILWEMGVEDKEIKKLIKQAKL